MAADAPLSLGPGREFDAIRAFVHGARLPDDVIVGPGDDAAVLDGGWVVTSDLSIEDVHFRRAWLSDREIGYRAAAAALSDLAAMGARAVGLLVALAVPRQGVDAAAVQAGAREAAEAVGAGVVGGDLSGSPGPLFLDVTALGRSATPVLRSGARPGHDVWVTGPLGGAAAAVRLWSDGSVPDGHLRRAFARPPLRQGVALRLAADHGAAAMVDLSDGLVGDAGHVAAGSGVRVVVEVPAVPLAPAAVAALGREDATEAALHGGEDYELCFTAEPGRVDPDALAAGLGVTLVRVGRVEAGEGVWLDLGHGDPVRAARGGFDHLEDAP